MKRMQLILAMVLLFCACVLAEALHLRIAKMLLLPMQTKHRVKPMQLWVPRKSMGVHSMLASSTLA